MLRQCFASGKSVTRNPALFQFSLQKCISGDHKQGVLICYYFFNYCVFERARELCDFWGWFDVGSSEND